MVALFLILLSDNWFEEEKFFSLLSELSPNSSGFDSFLQVISICGCSLFSSCFVLYMIVLIIGLPYYQLPDATPAQIKKAYYNCMKACHPDLSGDDPENTNFCMFINEVYAVGSQI